MEASSTRRIQSSDNRITRLMFNIEGLSGLVNSDVQCEGGVFFETHITNLAMLFVGVSRKFQSVSYAGVCKNDPLEQLSTYRASEVDRIVPIGKA